MLRLVLLSLTPQRSFKVDLTIRLRRMKPAPSNGVTMLTRYDFGNSVCCQKVRITMRAKGLRGTP